MIFPLVVAPTWACITALVLLGIGITVSVGYEMWGTQTVRDTVDDHGWVIDDHADHLNEHRDQLAELAANIQTLADFLRVDLYVEDVDPEWATKEQQMTQPLDLPTVPMARAWDDAAAELAPAVVTREFGGRTFQFRAEDVA